MELLLIKYASEIFLKGLNRGRFEKKLKENMKNVLKDEEYRFYEDQNRWFIAGENLETIREKIRKVFGVIEVCTVVQTERNLEKIQELALSALQAYPAGTTFKVVTKRADKNFPMDSMEVSRQVGAYLLKNAPGYSVEIKSPQAFIDVEIREHAYVYMARVKGIGGMPYGINGSTMLMLSGGIDSPVAGFLLAKRGIEVHGVYYHSHPYTSERAKDKVKELAAILAGYTGKFHLHVVPFTEIQMAIMDQCPENELTIIMRRFMMMCACALAKKYNIHSVSTGESVGQVASQTMEALVVSDEASDRPVFRPLVAMDKVDIMEISQNIGTYETSILPYEDCCTIFVPKHPVTKPKLEYIKKHEAVLPVEELVEKAIAGEEVFVL
ncbi:tRNA 4-thiouridine(8) synthase ThiI [Proteiniclasticum sp. BAD-10]|uniref:Probable tRNA sulfurtransferase n=1 Tax=Proteiniclasticum sediminis TaxID=2804028 RepID=A0A941CND5_9CLOT|nr:tRNA uracil 4-sulfurtransferase ThiI [Proteiniclasticum sediminis]MBR0575797.1 tRNA 4-thiouridine(8) synthase ThiI [Proteiniclasticum sediminis]